MIFMKSSQSVVGKYESVPTDVTISDTVDLRREIRLTLLPDFDLPRFPQVRVT